MADQWMPVVRIKMTLREFDQLPRQAAYKYEYFGGEAVLSPRPKYYHALLKLDDFQGDPDLEPVSKLDIREVCDEDFDELKEVFEGAFAGTQPFAGLRDDELKQAVHHSLHKTWIGGDGPLVRPACLMAAVDGKAVGAIFITLLPEGEATDYDSYFWKELPEEDLLEKRQGRAHLTWIFVSYFEAGHGVGTALLKEAVRILQEIGYGELYSTFMGGNDSSILWHWRNGFQLLSYPFSLRRMQKEISRKS